MSEKTYKNVPVSPETHARLEKLGKKGETFDAIVLNLLAESALLPKLKTVLKSASEKLERAKSEGRLPYASEAADEFKAAIEWAIKTIEAR